MSGSLKIVTVVNDFDTFSRCIGENSHLKDSEVIVFDNNVENIGVAERYNSFIDTLDENSDFWIGFLHQDFIFNENPLKKLENLPKNAIYGAVGIARQLFYWQFQPKFIFKIYRRCMLGQIFQGEENKTVGNVTSGNPKVKTVDCCCVIVHSSLIYQAGLRFDENLKFHMYAEDFCISARKKNIESRVVQFDARHLSGGTFNEELKKSAEYVKTKHKILRISSTCFK